MRYENFGPVANPDGSPTDLTLEMFGVSREQYNNMGVPDTERINFENALDIAYESAGTIDEAIDQIRDFFTLKEIDEAYDYLTEKYGDNEW